MVEALHSKVGLNDTVVYRVTDGPVLTAGQERIFEEIGAVSQISFTETKKASEALYQKLKADQKKKKRPHIDW